MKRTTKKRDNDPRVKRFLYGMRMNPCYVYDLMAVADKYGFDNLPDFLTFSTHYMNYSGATIGKILGVSKSAVNAWRTDIGIKVKDHGGGMLEINGTN